MGENYTRDAYTYLEYHFFDKQGNAIKIKSKLLKKLGVFFSAIQSFPALLQSFI
jgi:hypothetical protein